MPSTTFSPRPTRAKPRFDLAALGPGARAQLAAQGLLPTAPPPKAGRYRQAPAPERTVAGIVFDSKWEARAYVELCRHLPAAAIERQPAFELQAGFTDTTGKRHRPIRYVADYRITLPDGIHILDTKGHLTEIFRIKEKLFLHRHRQPLHKIYTMQQLRDFLRAHGAKLNS